MKLNFNVDSSFENGIARLSNFLGFEHMSFPSIYPIFQLKAIVYLPKTILHTLLLQNPGRDQNRGDILL